MEIVMLEVEKHLFLFSKKKKMRSSLEILENIKKREKPTIMPQRSPLFYFKLLHRAVQTLATILLHHKNIFSIFHNL